MRFFQLMANVRKQKNFIHSLQYEVTLATSQKDKHDIICNHFQNHLGSHVPRSCLLNLHELGWQPKQLAHLEVPFTEEDVKRVIMNAPKEKAPGPYSFVGLFFSCCWGIIKDDLMRVTDQFWMMN
jgi:hypothetical protein